MRSLCFLSSYFSSPQDAWAAVFRIYKFFVQIRILGFGLSNLCLRIRLLPSKFMNVDGCTVFLYTVQNET